MRTTFRSRASALALLRTTATVSLGGGPDFVLVRARAANCEQPLASASADTEDGFGADLGYAEDANLILLEDKVLPSEEIQAICKRHGVRARVVDPESGLLVREFGHNGIPSTPSGNKYSPPSSFVAANDRKRTPATAGWWTHSPRMPGIERSRPISSPRVAWVSAWVWLMDRGGAPGGSSGHAGVTHRRQRPPNHGLGRAHERPEIEVRTHDERDNPQHQANKFSFRSRCFDFFASAFIC